MAKYQLLIVLACTLASPIEARPPTNPSVPWGGCAAMAISKTRTEPYTLEEFKTLTCWYGLGNIDAGLEMARDYQRRTPPEYDNARVMLTELAKGTKKDGSSIEARANGGGGYGTARLNSDGSITEVLYRPPSPAAQRELAKFYLLGKGEDRDIEKAMDWLKKAEKGGDIEAGILRKALIEKGYAKK